MPDNNAPDDLGSFLSSVGQHAATGVTAAQATPPAQAADAINLSQKTGIPPQVVLADPDGAKSMADGSHPATISQNNPQMARWSMGEPTQVAASLPHYQWMDTVSKAFDLINKAIFVQPGEQEQPFKDPFTTGREQFIGGLKAAGQDIGDILGGLSGTNAPRGPDGNYLTLPGTLQGPIAEGKLAMDVGGAGWSGISGPLTSLVGTPLEHQFGVRREVIGQVLTMLLPFIGKVPNIAKAFGGKPLAAGEGPTPSPSPRPEDFNTSNTAAPPGEGSRFGVDERGFVASDQGGPLQFEDQKSAARWILDTGNKQSPDQIFDIENHPSGAGFTVKQRGIAEPTPAPVEEHPSVQMANENAQVIDAVHQAVQSNEMTKNVPTVMNNFLHQLTDDSPTGILAINPQVALAAYKDRMVNGLPVSDPKDGILGWVPDIQTKAVHALLTGQDLKVPTADYLTNVSEEGHALLREGLSFGDGRSVADAELFAKMPAQEAAPTETQKATVETPAIAPSVEQAIAKARQENYLNPLFKDAETIGMTEPQFKLYAQAVQKADEAFKERVVGQQAKQMKLEQNKEWRAEADRRNEDAWKIVAQDRAARARHFLATGEDIGLEYFTPTKLDRKSVAKSYPDIIKELPRDLFGENGAEPDDVAQAFGFRHGEQMLREIADLERLRNTEKFLTGEVRSVKQHTLHMIEQELTKLVSEKLGNFLSPEQLEYAARLGVSSQGVQNLLTEELRALAQKAGLPFSKPTMEKAALDAFHSMQVKDAINLKALERTVGRGGREAEVSLLKKKYPEAFKAKQRQFIATRILGHATDFQKVFAQADRRFRAIARHPVIVSTDQHYVNYVHDALMQAGYRVKRSPRELQSALEGVTLPEFVLGKERGGYSIYYHPWMPGAVKDMTVEDFESMRNSIKSLLKVGRDEKVVYVAQQKLDLQGLVDRAATQRATFGEKWTQEQLHEHYKRVLGPQQSIAGKLRKAINLRNLDAGAVVPEFLVDELDMGDFHGVYNQVVMDPAQTAKHKLDELSDIVADKFLTFNKTQPSDWSGTLDDPVDVPYRYFDRDGGVYLPIKNRGDLLGAAIHWGNTENQYKLVESGLSMTDGSKISHDDMQRAFDFYMRKEDWDFVQHLWDTSEELWQMARDMHGRMSGVKPPNVEPQAFDAHGVTYRGGHAPIFYDALLGRDVKSKTPTDALFGDDYLRSLPSKGYTIKRNTYTAPLEMDIDLYRIRFAQMILDISHREAIVNMRKFLNHPDVRRGLNKQIGQEYSEVLTSLPNRIANSRMLDDRNSKWYNDLAKLLRRNVVIANIGFKLSTIEKHLPTAWIKSVDEVGLKELTWAVGELSKGNLLDNWKAEIAESPELTRRMQSMDRDMATQLTALTAKYDIVQKAQDISTMGVGMSDLISAVPTYKAAKNKALRMGETLEDAIKIGEKAVRKAHGAGAHIDLPMLLDPQGDNAELMKLATVFTTFINNSYNRLRAATQRIGSGVQDVKAGDYAKGGKKFIRSFITYSMVGYASAWYVLNIEGAYHKGESLGKKFAKTAVWGATGGIPIANNILRSMVGGAGDYTSSVFDQVARSVLTSVGDAKKLLDNAYAKITGHTRKLLPPDIVKHSIVTAGDVLGVPGAQQISKPAQYMTDVATGRAHPHSFGNWVRGFSRGK